MSITRVTWPRGRRAFGAPAGSRASPRRDDIVFRDIASRLMAAGLLDAVERGVRPEQAPIGADRAAVAWLRRERWRETAAPGDGAYERTVTYTLWLGVKEADFGARADRLAQIEAVAQNALDGQVLGGFTMWAFTKLGEGVDEWAGDGESRVRLPGTFRYYLVNGRDGHDESDPP